nr:MAG TPA: hypothetical protein [Caudoviricetes sp.]
MLFYVGRSYTHSLLVIYSLSRGINKICKGYWLWNQ